MFFRIFFLLSLFGVSCWGYLYMFGLSSVPPQQAYWNPLWAAEGCLGAARLAGAEIGKRPAPALAARTGCRMSRDLPLTDRIHWASIWSPVIC